MSGGPGLLQGDRRADPLRDEGPRLPGGAQPEGRGGGRREAVDKQEVTPRRGRQRHVIHVKDRFWSEVLF